MEIRILHKQGKSLRAIACEIGYSVDTVGKYLAEDSTPPFKGRVAGVTKLAPFEVYLRQREASAAPVGFQLLCYGGRSKKWASAINARQ